MKIQNFNQALKGVWQETWQEKWPRLKWFFKSWAIIFGICLLLAFGLELLVRWGRRNSMDPVEKIVGSRVMNDAYCYYRFYIRNPLWSDVAAKFFSQSPRIAFTMLQEIKIYVRCRD